MLRSKQKRTMREEGSPASGWEIIYSGFVIILLCFFIMLSSFASMEQGKVMQFVKSFSNALKVMPGGVSMDSGKIIMPSAMGLVDPNHPMASVAEALKEMEALEENKGARIQLALSDGDLILRLSEGVLFESGQADIRPDAVPILKKIARVIANTPQEVRIEGHTDNVPIRTWRYPSNWDLSTARAVNVLRHFIVSERIEADRLSALGYGQHQPLSANDTPEGRAANRRVEIVFVGPKPVNPISGNWQHEGQQQKN